MSLIEPDLHLQKPLEEFCERLEKLNRRSLPILMSLYAPSCSYDDPYHTVHGVEAMQTLWMRKMHLCADLQYRVHDFMWGRRSATASVFWSACFSSSRKRLLRSDERDDHVIEGVSELVFTMDGSILSYAEFWGRHSEIFDAKAYAQDVDVSKGT